MVAGAPGHNRFVGKNAEAKSLPNGTPVTKFSVATNKSWKGKNDAWQPRRFGGTFAQSADRLVKGADVFVQGELTTREYDRTIRVPDGNGKTI